MVQLDELSEVGVGIRPSLEKIIGPDAGLEILLEKIIESGTNLLDIATILGAGRVEKSLGRLFDQLGCRNQLFVIAKGGVRRDSTGQLLPEGRPELVKQGVKESLERLGFDRLDCYQIYWPDDTVPLAETVGALDELREKGLIRHLGVTNFTAAQLSEAEKGGEVDLVQFPYNLFQFQAERDLLPYCRDKEIKKIAYGTLCRGLLTDDFLESGELEFDTLSSNLKHVRDNFDLYRQAVNDVADYLEQQGFDLPLASIMIAWTLAQPGVESSVTVAHNPAQVDVISKASEVELTVDQAEQISSTVKQVIGDAVDRDFIVPPHVESGD